MQRLPPIAPERQTDAQARAAAEFASARGGPVFGPFLPLLYSPELMSAARQMGDYLRFRSALPPRLSELAILITARHWTQQFEWGIHATLAVEAGLSADTVSAIADGRRPPHLAGDEEILYDFCSELLVNRGVSDATYARALAAFHEQGVVDAVGIAGYYSLLAMILNTAQLPPGPGRPTLRPFPR